MFQTNPRIQRVLLTGCLVTGLIALLLLFWVNNSQYFFTTAPESEFKKWYPVFHTIAFAVARSFLFSRAFLETITTLAFTAALLLAITLPGFFSRQNIIVCSISLLTALLCAEIFFRIRGEFKTYTERALKSHYVSPFKPLSDTWIFTSLPNQTYRSKTVEFEYPIIINNEGIPNPVVSLKKTMPRIVILGDSYTAGVGAPYDSSYSRLLENMLNSDSGINAEVINAGVQGSDPCYEYQLLRLKLLKYKPDVVLTMVNSSDITDAEARGGFERFVAGDKVKYKKGPWFEVIYRFSFLGRQIVHKLFKYDYLFRTPEQVRAGRKEAAYVVSTGIDSLRQLCNRENIRFYVVFLPYATQVFSGYDNAMDEVLNFCFTHSIPTIDIRDVFVKEIGSPHNLYDYYWKVDGHCKAKGYHTMANYIYQSPGFKQTVLKKIP